jgi:hypothetical protein
MGTETAALKRRALKRRHWNGGTETAGSETAALKRRHWNVLLRNELTECIFIFLNHFKKIINFVFYVLYLCLRIRWQTATATLVCKNSAVSLDEKYLLIWIGPNSTEIILAILRNNEAKMPKQIHWFSESPFSFSFPYFPLHSTRGLGLIRAECRRKEKDANFLYLALLFNESK